MREGYKSEHWKNGVVGHDVVQQKSVACRVICFGKSPLGIFSYVNARHVTGARAS